jgi:hypothetical protein
MIKLKKLEQSTETGRNNYQVILDDIPAGEGYAFDVSRDGVARVYASLYELKDGERFASHRFNELPTELQEMELRLDFEWPETVFRVDVRRTEQDVNGFELGFKFEFPYEDWKGTYSFAEYAHAFEVAVSESHTFDMRWIGHTDDLANGFEITFRVRAVNSRMIEEISRCSILLERVDEIALAALEAEVDEKSLVVSFDFPEEIRIPCEQYLIYFVQFLKDLGVEANSNLEHRAGTVLFSVTPTDEKDALDKIRETLELYLHFPSSPFGNTDYESIAVQRLESNVLHLRSELKLAAAELQAKNATIQAQQLTIGVQSRLLSHDVMVDSIKNVTPKSEDKEPLLGGVVALATFKEKGFEINWGELFRKLRSKFANEK